MFSILLVFKILVAVVIAVDKSDDEKHDYTIELKKVSVEIMSQMYFSKDTYFLIVMFNDTSSVMEGVMDFTKAPPHDLVIKFVASLYDKATNQYVQKAVQSHPFCDFIKQNHYIMDNIYKDSNFPRACPIQKGKYYINNMVVDNTEFPKHIEASTWRAELELNSKNNMGPPYLLLLIDADIVPVEEDVEEEESEE